MIYFKRLVLIIVMGLVCQSTNAQKSFVPQSFSKNAVTEYTFSSCEPSMGRFVFVGDRRTDDSTGFVFLTDNDGTVIKSKYLFAKKDSINFVGFSCIANSNATISIIGRTNSYYYNQAFDVWYALIDTNLNILEYKLHIITKADTQLRELAPFVAINNHIYGAAKFRIVGKPYPLYTKLLKLDQAGNLIKSQVLDSAYFGSNNENMYSVNDVSVSKNPAHLLLTNTFFGYFIRTDTNFVFLDSIKIFSNLFRNSIGDSSLNDSVPFVEEVSEDNLIFGPNISVTSFMGPIVGAVKFDAKTKKMTSIMSFPPQTNQYLKDYNAGYSGMCQNENGIYFTGYTTGYRLRDFIIVAKVDTFAQPQWIRYYGDSLEAYNAISISTCKDGSVMVSGFRDTGATPFLGNTREDFFVLRLDAATGFPLSIRSISEQLRSGISLYPNPARDAVYIKGAAMGSQVVFYDINGKMLLQERIGSQGQKINVQSLAPGSYIYHIIGQERQKISSGKWIKQ